MALRAKYQAFLNAPSPAQLAPGASINYIPTLTTVAEPDAIVKHLSAQTRLLTKKGEKVLSAIESSDGLCLDIETHLEFKTGGGAYLPGLDDNFVSDRTVLFPTVHIVQFDSQQKITSIRLYWDQASLLKQVDVIGSRARNWPIRDGKDQARLITVTAAGGSSATSSRRNTTASNGDDFSRPQTSRSSTSATKDPHASLSLFQPNEDDDARSQTPSEYSVERVRSARPAHRGLAEILSPEHQAPERSSSPAKAGAGKNFHPIRLFDEEEEDSANVKSPERKKAHPKKYEHFDFGEGEDAPPVEQASKSKKHTSQWDFESFTTPEQTRTKVLPQHTKQFGWSDDEDAEESPIKRPVVHQPRKDAKTHFDFDDEATPVADRTKDVSKGGKHNKGLGLYKDPVLGEDEDDSGKNGPLSNVTKNVNNEKRSKHFNSQFAIADDSPSTSHVAKPGDENGSLPETKKKVLKGLDANWDLYDQSPKQRGINIGGDGMGGRKGTRRDYIFGGDDEEPEPEKPVAQRKTSRRNENQPSDKSFWDF